MNENKTYRGAHGNSRLGRSCKTPIPRRRRSGRRTKNPLLLNMGSVNYLLKNPESTDTTNQYTEYAYVNGHFERLGSEHATIVAENISDEAIKKLWTE